MSGNVGNKQSTGAVFNNNNTGTFNTCSATVRDHVLGAYLKAKIANLIGVSREAIMWGQPIMFSFPYANDEGVIKGFDIEKGLRIDLQKAQLHKDQAGKDQHYACLQVQWGTGSKNTGGAYAGALIRVSHVFSLLTIHDALEKSFEWGKYCRVDPPLPNT